MKDFSGKLILLISILEKKENEFDYLQFLNDNNVSKVNPGYSVSVMYV